jgi:hypothetical protein
MILPAIGEIPSSVMAEENLEKRRRQPRPTQFEIAAGFRKASSKISKVFQAGRDEIAKLAAAAGYTGTRSFS